MLPGLFLVPLVRLCSILLLLPKYPWVIFSTVYHPTEPGEYGVVFFISGLGGYIPSFIYENHLANVSAHGYIVASSMFLLSMSTEDWATQNQNMSRKEVEKMLLREDNENLGDRADVYWKVLIWVKSIVSRQIIIIIMTYSLIDTNILQKVLSEAI